MPSSIRMASWSTTRCSRSSIPGPCSSSRVGPVSSPCRSRAPAGAWSASTRRAATAGAAVEFVEGDMRGFDLGVACGLIFIARNSLLHLTTASEFAETLAAVRRHLAPGGVFAFDVFNPDVRILARSPGERAFVMRAHSERYGELTAEATSDYDAATRVNRATWYISTPDHRDRWVAPMHLRSIFPQELPLLLAASGFRLLQRMGDLNGGPFTSSSARQLCVCVVDDGERRG